MIQTFDPLSFLLGATCAALALYILAIIVEAWRKFIGHHVPRGPLGV